MKTKKASNKALKHIVCCIIIIVAFVVTFTKVHAQNLVSESTNEVESVVPLKPQLNESLLELKRINREEVNTTFYSSHVVLEKDINYYINENLEELTFFANMFGYDIESIKNDIIERNKNTEYNETNIANLKDVEGNVITYPNTSYGMVEYFYYLTNNSELTRTRNLVPYEGSSDYVEKLIIYYTKIYNNVDTSVALSIGAAESGYYTVKYMLRMNNVYGGMGSNGLIRNDNIELGVLNYIRMLSLNYYGKGLDTIYEIGYVYCPTVNESGYKIASPHWINLVNKAKEKYDTYSYDVTINDLVK